MNSPSHTMLKPVSRAQRERCYSVAKKLLRFFGFKPELIDVFSKKQKQLLFDNIFDFPVVRAEKAKTIPRRFLDEIREALISFMKNEYIGNPENKLTYMEFVTYGLGFVMEFRYHNRHNRFAATPQQVEAAKQIQEKVTNIEELFTEKIFAPVFAYLLFLTKSISQVNFRLYGYKFTWESVGFGFRIKVELTSQNCESKMFTHNGVKRKAFRLMIAEDGLSKPGGAVVSRNKIFPKAKEDEHFNIYIQSHMLHRFKERVNIFEAQGRNYLLQTSLTFYQKIVTTDKKSFFACTLDDYPIGYYTFFVDGGDIVLNTFIPLVNENTPEGKKLHELLPLAKEDIIYLGMDKISFFSDIDFEQIPILKQALIDSNIWQSKQAIDEIQMRKPSNKDVNLVDMNKTMFVKRFFDKIAEA